MPTKNFIVSPTYGRVMKANDEEITIFIPYKQNHKIFTPISSIVKNIKSYKGKFKRTIVGKKRNKIFEVTKIKRGRVVITLIGNIELLLYIEVGFPFRPNRIRIDVNVEDKLRKGSIIGEILLGSLSEIHFPKNIEVKPLVSYMDNVIGGKTKIADYVV
jgi:hypothetical protein